MIDLRIAALSATCLLCFALPAVHSQAPSDTGEGSSQACVDLDEIVPGLYATSVQNQIYLIQGDDTVELNPGEAAYATADELSCLGRVPDIMDWPCGTAADRSRRRWPTYDVESLPGEGAVQEVINRFLDGRETIEPIPVWLNGEYHRNFAEVEIRLIEAAEYWYLPDRTNPILSAPRPATLLVSLYRSTRQSMPDFHTLGPLTEQLSSGQLPVLYLFNEDNVVPVSYFGPGVNLEALSEAWYGNHVRVTPVPLWERGDHHLLVYVTESEKFFDIPELEEIDDDRLEALVADLRENGFSKKPIFVTMMADSGMSVDQAERIRAAESIGIDPIPTVIFYFDRFEDYARCGYVGEILPDTEFIPISFAREEQFVAPEEPTPPPPPPTPTPTPTPTPPPPPSPPPPPPPTSPS